MTDGLTGSYALPHMATSYFSQDRMTVLAGRLPGRSATGEIALTRGVARLFHVGVGGEVTYQFYKHQPRDVRHRRRPGGDAFRVTAIVDIPPVLGDQADEVNSGILPPAATRALLGSYEFAWVGVRLRHGAAGIPELQHRLAGLAASMLRQARAAHDSEPGLTLGIRNFALLQAQVQQAIRPQVIALAIFAAVAAVALLVLVGQGLAQLLSRSAAGYRGRPGPGRHPRPGRAGRGHARPGRPGGRDRAGRGRSGRAVAAGAGRAGPPVRPGPRRAADGWPCSAAALALLVAALLVLAAWPGGRSGGAADPAEGRPSAVARRRGRGRAAGCGRRSAAGNALERGSGRRAAPVRATLAGSVAAVTAVVAAWSSGPA